MHLDSKRILLIIVFLIGGGLALAFVMDKGRSQKFNLVGHGNGETDVWRLLGRPGAARKCGDYIAWGDADTAKKNTGICVKEFIYDSWIPFSSEYWAIGFNAEHKVVSKYHYR